MANQADTWTDRDYALLMILEDIASPDVDPDKTLMGYIADITDLFES